MAEPSLELLKGTLDVLILKTLSGGAMHGYGISRSIREATHDAFRVEEGALYPALRRLEKRGMVVAKWDVTDTGRSARFYDLTPAGTAELSSALRSWHRYVEAMGRVLGAASGS